MQTRIWYGSFILLFRPSSFVSNARLAYTRHQNLLAWHCVWGDGLASLLVYLQSGNLKSSCRHFSKVLFSVIGHGAVAVWAVTLPHAQEVRVGKGDWGHREGLLKLPGTPRLAQQFHKICNTRLVHDGTFVQMWLSKPIHTLNRHDKVPTLHATVKSSQAMHGFTQRQPPLVIHCNVT